MTRLPYIGRTMDVINTWNTKLRGRSTKGEGNEMSNETEAFKMAAADNVTECDLFNVLERRKLSHSKKMNKIYIYVCICIYIFICITYIIYTYIVIHYLYLDLYLYIYIIFVF